MLGLCVSGVSRDWLGGELRRLKTDLVRVGSGLILLILLVMLVVLMPTIILAISSTVVTLRTGSGPCGSWTVVEMSGLGSSPCGSVVAVPEKPMKVTWSVNVVEER